MTIGKGRKMIQFLRPEVDATTYNTIPVFSCGIRREKQSDTETETQKEKEDLKRN